MRLAHPRRPQEQDILTVFQIAAGGDLPDDLDINGGLEFKVDALERLLEWESRHRYPHRQMLLRLGPDFPAQHLFEKFSVGGLLRGSLLQERGQFRGHLIQAQTMTVRVQSLELRRGGRHRAPPASATAA